MLVSLSCCATRQLAAGRLLDATRFHQHDIPNLNTQRGHYPVANRSLQADARRRIGLASLTHDRYVFRAARFVDHADRDGTTPANAGHLAELLLDVVRRVLLANQC